MSRTSRYKATYFAIVIAGTFLLLWGIVHFHPSALAIVCVVIALLIPGRVLGFFWRNLFRGLHLLNAKDFVGSKRHSELFLNQLRDRRWLKKLIWLGTSTYSRDPEALALNNLGAAEIGLGEFESARGHLDASIAVDGENPLPYFNIGVLLCAEGELAEARKWLSDAVARGYSQGLTDRIIAASQARFALTEGRGRT